MVKKIAFLSFIFIASEGLPQKFLAKDITLIVPWAAGGRNRHDRKGSGEKCKELFWS
ncbi:MAG: hypothetical protein ACUVTN_05255 [Thermodesulfobacteriota bacterium]